APSAEPKKDRKLLGILIAAVLVPIALFVVGVVSIGLLWRADVSVGSMTLGTGLRGEEVPAYVNEWVAACDANGAGVYVLKPNAETAKAHMEEMGDLGLDGEDIYFVYIYMNAHKGENSGKAFYGTGEILDNLGDEDEVEIKYETTYANAPEKVPDFELSVVGIEGYGIEDLRIYIDGEITPYCVTQMP
ncbi:MAG: hypothetical protein LBM28_03045, partial [Oscillospiraceae bacterium]|nr:hypothetical protein [Oscillospiraceae bacterium]